jgi:hypothetical protein
VEEAAAAAVSLEDQAAELQDAAATFRLRDSHSAVPALSGRA